MFYMILPPKQDASRRSVLFWEGAFLLKINKYTKFLITKYNPKPRAKALHSTYFVHELIPKYKLTSS